MVRTPLPSPPNCLTCVGPTSIFSLLILLLTYGMYQKNIHILKDIVDAVVLCDKQRLPHRGHRDDRSSRAYSIQQGSFFWNF